ncbi:MAG: hypothetical protein QM579_08350 [Desulfovibrio sp.]|uniref:hypothetical protein n=1 Tax=Desulfovibrio sp. TaxID=885 RepID=UPI0039E59071
MKSQNGFLAWPDIPNLNIWVDAWLAVIGEDAELLANTAKLWKIYRAALHWPVIEKAV